MVHQVAGHHRPLPAGLDVDAAMAGRVARSRRQPHRVIQGIVVVHQQRLARLDDRQAVIGPDVAGRLLALLRRLLPGGILPLVEHILGVREGRHPAAVAQHRIPAAMVDVQVGAEHVVDRLEAQARRLELIEVALLREIHRRGIALILAGAGVDQDRVMRRAHHEGLVGDDHHPRRRIEHHRIQRIQMLGSHHRIIGREHVGGFAPGAIALDNAGDRHVADCQGLHPVVPSDLKPV